MKYLKFKEILTLSQQAINTKNILEESKKDIANTKALIKMLGNYNNQTQTINKYDHEPEEQKKSDENSQKLTNLLSNSKTSIDAIKKQKKPPEGHNSIMFSIDKFHIYAGYVNKKEFLTARNSAIYFFEIDIKKLIKKEVKFHEVAVNNLPKRESDTKTTYEKLSEALTPFNQGHNTLFILTENSTVHEPLEDRLAKLFEFHDYKARDKLIVKLDKYIKRIESQKIDKSEQINFAYGFIFFKKSQATNREANYALAKYLKKQLETSEKSIADIFTNPLDIRLHEGEKITDFQKNNRGINSRELNQVISEAQNMTITDLNDRHYTHKF